MLPGHIILEGEVAEGQEFVLEGPQLDSLMLWGPRAFEAVTVTNAQGDIFRARVLSISEKQARLVLFERHGKAKDLYRRFYLLQALPERERMELIIQKAAELGVTHIIPFKAEKSTSLDERDSRQKKSHKWQEIALKASKQSRGFFITQVLPYSGFTDAIDMAGKAGLKLLLWERQGLKTLKEALREGARGADTAILCGPEGGVTENEVSLSERAGFVPVSLGRRILRTETAAIVGAAIVQYEVDGL